MGQRYVNTSVFYPLSVQLKATKDFPPIANLFLKKSRDIKERVERTGAVRSATFLSEIESGVPGQRFTEWALKLFSEVEKGNQTFTAIVAGYGIERDLELYAKSQTNSRLRKVVDSVLSLGDKSKGAIERRLQRSGVNNLTNEQLAHMLSVQNGKMTPEQIEAAMHRLVADTQFPITLASKRIWWNSHPWLKLMFKFKPFGIEQVSMIYQNVVKETAKGNFAPMVRFVVWTVLMGEMYNILRDWLTGREEAVTTMLAKDKSKWTPKDIAWHLAKNLADGGGVGILSDLIWGIGDMVGGPLIGTWTNAKRSVIDVIRKPSQAPTAIRDFFGREIAVNKQLKGFVNRADEKLVNQNNRFFEYQAWRQRSFEFRDKKRTGGEKLESAKEIAVGIVEGMVGYGRTERTLRYEYAARQITVGDINDAADYLSSVLRDAKTREERDATLKGIRLSMKSKSPLGKVALKDRKAFLSKYSAEDQFKARLLERDWLRDYEKAIRIAIGKSWRK